MNRSVSVSLAVMVLVCFSFAMARAKPLGKTPAIRPVPTDYYVVGDPNAAPPVNLDDVPIDQPIPIDERNYFKDHDEVGIHYRVLSMLPNIEPTILQIGAEAEARLGFLVDTGFTAPEYPVYFDACIGRFEEVNGTYRLKVSVGLGRKVVEFDGAYHGNEVVAALYELWTVNADGSNPVLLQRSRRQFNGLQTLQESPLPVIPGSPW
jgi:hypothetical protein